jgi:hypothetical protein
MRITSEYNMEEEVLKQKNWKMLLKSLMADSEWKKWRMQASEKEALLFQTKTNRLGPEPLLDEDKWAKAFCLVRLGDDFKLAGAHCVSSYVLLYPFPFYLCCLPILSCSLANWWG